MWRIQLLWWVLKRITSRDGAFLELTTLNKPKGELQHYCCWMNFSTRDLIRSHQQVQELIIAHLEGRKDGTPPPAE